MSNTQVIATFSFLVTALLFFQKWLFSKKINYYFVIAAVMPALSMLEKENLGHAFLLIFLAEIFCTLSKKNFKKYFSIWLPWAFLLLAYIFREDKFFTQSLVFIFALLKIFNWPLKFLSEKEEDEIEGLITKFLIPLAVCYAVMSPAEGLWVISWVIAVFFLSWGGREGPLITALSIALIAANDAYMPYALTLGGVGFLNQKYNLLAIPVAAIAGFLIFQFLPTVNDFSYVYPLLLAVVLARTTIYEAYVEKEILPKQQAAIMTIVILFSALALWLAGIQIAAIKTEGLIYVGALIVCCAGFYIYYPRNPKIFKPAKSFAVVEALFKRIKETELYQLERAEETKIKEVVWAEKVLDFTKTGAYILIIVSFFSIFIFWRRF